MIVGDDDVGVLIYYLCGEFSYGVAVFSVEFFLIGVRRRVEEFSFVDVGYVEFFCECLCWYKIVFFIC